MALDRAVAGQLGLSNPGGRITCILPSVPSLRSWDRAYTYRCVTYGTLWPLWPVTLNRLTGPGVLGAPGHSSWLPLEDLSTRPSTLTLQRNQIGTLSSSLPPKVQDCSVHADVPIVGLC